MCVPSHDYKNISQVRLKRKKKNFSTNQRRRICRQHLICWKGLLHKSVSRDNLLPNSTVVFDREMNSHYTHSISYNFPVRPVGMISKFLSWFFAVTVFTDIRDFDIVWTTLSHEQLTAVECTLSTSTLQILMCTTRTQRQAKLFWLLCLWYFVLALLCLQVAAYLWFKEIFEKRKRKNRRAHLTVNLPVIADLTYFTLN